MVKSQTNMTITLGQVKEQLQEHGEYQMERCMRAAEAAVDIADIIPDLVMAELEELEAAGLERGI